jgi:ABC-type metal ion transport system, periplasmic component/surface adhesin
MKLRNMILVGLVAMCLIGTTSVQALQAEKEGKIGVIVTILPQAEFVEKIGGNRVSVMVMVPPGASPHSYEPKPDQLVQVSKAKMYAKVGSGVEFERVWMDKIINTNREMVVVNCSRGIELIEGDPHVWLSPKKRKDNG